MTEFRKPGMLLTLSEGLRSLIDLGDLTRRWPELLPRRTGPARVVMVLPGLGLGDASTMLLRSYLAGLGHRVYGWRQGLNLGLERDQAHRLAGAVAALAADHGQGVVLVGHSVGALFARLVAWLRPESVAEIVTLAGPFRDSEGQGSRAIELYYALNPVQRDPASDAGALFQQAMALVPSVPVTCVFTRADGVLDWRSTVQQGHLQQQNLEVRGSHLGLVVNPTVWRLLALRLAAPEPWAPLLLPADLAVEVCERVGWS